MKIIIIGGHLSPALAVIEGLKNDQVYYLGRKHALEGDSALSLEYQTISKLNIPFYEIKTGRLQRQFTKHTLSSIARLPIGFAQSLRIIKKINPDVVLGFGGYVSFPVVIAAFILKIPIVIHEQTLEAGFANKILARFADKICISWESSRTFFPNNKTILTGNPLRKDLIEAKALEKKQNSIASLYITGGSLGSHTINSLVAKTLPKLLEKFSILHQTGDAQNFNDFENLKSLKENLSPNIAKRYELKKFLTSKEAIDAIANADIIIARSGINTVCELIYLQKPCLLIPISFSQRGEQLKNARFIKDLGLAEIINEKIITPDDFSLILENMLKKLSRYKLQNLINVVDDNAAAKLIQIVRNVSKKKTP